MIGLGSLVACKSYVNVGIMSDAGTGLKASYKNMQPEDVVLLMNDKVMPSADIPHGESFILFNNNTTGLIAKEGKVSVGCSLVIKDQQGNVLMNEPDLFKDNDLLEASETTDLRCIVNTGNPMEVGAKYDVTATFWDKYGTGNIVNNLTVHMTPSL